MKEVNKKILKSTKNCCLFSALLVWGAVFYACKDQGRLVLMGASYIGGGCLIMVYSFISKVLKSEQDQV
ncbi:MAG: hypothetical protein ABH954_02190 [Candidatus Omnitrophota bacterium]